MPQIKILGRRWRLATDTLPLLAGFMAAFHLAFLVPLITVYTTTNASTYRCDRRRYVRAAIQGILFTYAASIVNELVIVFLGLRGGPLEERKRRLVKPLLYLESVLFVSALGFTILATVMVASPSVEASCFSNNPCAAATEIIPQVCTLDGTGAYMLSPPCAEIGRDADKFQGCFEDWADYGATYALNSYNASAAASAAPPLSRSVFNLQVLGSAALPTPTGPFNPPPADPAALCNRSIAAEGDFFKAWLKQRNILQDSPYFAPSYLSAQDNATAAIESAFLAAIGVPYADGAVAQAAPWWPCLDSQCQALLRAGDRCTEWSVLLHIPDSTNRKKTFEAVVWCSWAILAMTSAVVWGAFNALPDYESSDSWEKQVKALSRLFCCHGELTAAETEGGQPAAKEIGNLMHLLFGAIDLDATDRLLGMYLVAERQRLRREAHVLRVLKEAGVGPPPAPRRGRFSALLAWLRSRSVRARSLVLLPSVAAPRGGALTSTLDELPSDVRREAGSCAEQESLRGAGGGNGGATVLPPAVSSAATQPHSPGSAAAFRGAQLRPSPFSVESSNGSNFSSPFASSTPSLSPAARPELGDDADAHAPFALSHSIVRLVTARRSSAALAGLQPPLPPSSPAGEERAGSAAGTEVERSKPSLLLSQPASGLRLEVAGRRQPLLTPVSLRRRRLPLSSYEAARVYLGDGRGGVGAGQLQEALDMSKFALAAYGLQGMWWRGGALATEGARPCGARVDRALTSLDCCGCMRRPLGLDTHFRKRNFSTILEVTGIDPGDLVYVSYANAPFGILPYMLLLHRPSRSVVLAIRGTVGMADMITDLLSNPVDARKALPEWVLQVAAPEDQLFAHSGILSSANAVLKDLEERGLLQEVLASRLGGTGSDALAGGSSSSGQPTRAPLQHAHMQRQATLETVHESGASPSSPSPLRDESGEWEEAGGCGGGDDEAPGATSAPEARRLERIRTLGDEELVELPLVRARSMLRDRIASRGWRLVVTGHSLGAAAACLLSFHLRQRFPDVRCLAFCPPGGLLSAALSRLARPFCTSVIVGCDAISRLGVATTQRVVDDMVLALARCKRAKLKVAVDLVAGRRDDPASAPPTFCGFDDIGPEAVAVLGRYCATSKLHAASTDLRELVPPGRVIHLRPYDAAPCSASEPPPPPPGAGKRAAQPAEVWDAVWVTPEDVVGEGILLSRSMMRHHRMPTLQAALRSALAREAAPGGGAEAKGEEAV